MRDVEPSGTNGPKACLTAPLKVRGRCVAALACAAMGESPWRFLPVPVARRPSGGTSAGAHLFPSRTEKLSPAAAMILRASVGK